MFNDELSLLLSNIVYLDTLYKQPVQWATVNVSEFTNTDGFYAEANGFACKAYKNGNEIVISFRGTDSLTDIIVSDTLIAAGLIPSTSLTYAENFYKAIVKEYCPQDANGNLTIDGITYNTNNISFTGHSLGGAIAELLGAEYGNTTVTFNAPGMLNMLDQVGASSSINYSNITNYVVMNDYVGNLRAHVGDTYYIQPVPIETDPWRDTHNSILNYTATVFGEIMTKPEAFGTQEALSLWYYDANNTLAAQSASGVADIVSVSYLETAINIINTDIGTPLHTLHYSTSSGDYIIDNAYGNEWTGTDKNDTVWGNGGNDLIRGCSGDDEIHGGIGDDTIYAGSLNSTNDGKNDLYGDSGKDYIVGGDGNDYIDGGADNDVLVGGAGNDFLIGGAGDDYLTDGEGVDFLMGGAGNDYYFMNYETESGQDVIIDWDGKGSVNAGGTVLTGGVLVEGTTDTFKDDYGFTYVLSGRNLNISQGDFTFSIDHYSNSNLGIHLTDENGNDIITESLYISGTLDENGNPVNEVLAGTSGNDTINGNGGCDTIYGGAGNDLLKGHNNNIIKINFLRLEILKGA